MDRQRPRRAGFTLIEVLVAIIIVATLVAILLPAIGAAFRRAKEAQAAAEMNNLASALADFKQKFGEYPPSRVILCEGGYNAFLSSSYASQVIPGPSGNGVGVTDITYGQLAQRSALYLNKFWPRVDFYGGPSSTTPVYGTYHDFNGNHAYDGANANFYVLSGAECLVFFLGGLSAYTTDPSTNISSPTGLTGFSRSPTLPFLAQSYAPNRTAPIYEFNGGRLKDLDHDGVPTYIDPFANGETDSVPYAYFSAYGNNSYDPNDVNDNGHSLAFGKGSVTYSGENVEMDESGTPYPIIRKFNVAFPPNAVNSSAPNPYTTSQPVNASGTNYINPTTFQIFSAGQDRLWGLGGLYSATAAGGSRLPLSNGANETNLTSPDDFNATVTTDLGGAIRSRERDNITNFSGGRLD